MSAPDAVNCGLCERTPCACPVPDSPSGRPLLDALENPPEPSPALKEAFADYQGATQAADNAEVPVLRHCADCDRPELCDWIKAGTAPCGKNAGIVAHAENEFREGAMQMYWAIMNRGLSYVASMTGLERDAFIRDVLRARSGASTRQEVPQSDDRRALAVPTREALVAAFEDVADNHTLVARATYPHQGQDEVRAAKRRLGDAIGTRDTLLDALYAALSAAQRDTERLRTALQRLVDTEMDESGGNYDGAAKLRDAVYDAMEVLGPRLTPSDQRSSSEVK